MEKNRVRQVYQSKTAACLLSLCAGFIDAYTFIERGGTLVAGQTGNVVFLSVEVVQHHTNEIEVKVATMVSFMFGIFLLSVVQPLLARVRWRLISLIPMLLLCLVIGFLPTEVSNLWIVPPLSFCMGFCATAFSEVKGLVYNNSFMTGNIKKMMVAFGQFARTREPIYWKEAVFFVCLVASFGTGALSSAWLGSYFHLQTIWFAALVLLLFLALPFLIPIRLFQDEGPNHVRNEGLSPKYSENS
ncbi:YoaK family protein [Streptococcus sp. DD13]|uniref:YoaK family protein n=1 Tax=Streptococcus sp. DD13 TaxID=1777881 RepID=UPI000796B741|nr:YoaK family protein [Streptococcus sp. DD13]KXT78379.1 hypothetical protein STRDD13_00784 [Streptococcus sp. DD13]